MGDTILRPVVEVTVSKVISVASDQLNLALGWNQDLQKFCSMMEMLRGVLQDADADEKNVSGRRSGLKCWLQQLRTVADEADDILEEVVYENMRRQVVVQKSKWRKVRYFFTRSDPRALVFRLKMANKVKNLNKSLADINRLANHLGLQFKHAIKGAGPWERPAPETHSFLPSRVFGREEDVSKIVSLLVDSSNQHDLPVITIVGMPGLGKTTLARAVLENDKIGEHFGKNKMWVCVSENFNVKRILVEMLKSISGSGSGDRDVGSNDNVMKDIQNKLEEKNYLLILDDVWNEKRLKWEELRNCLLGISRSKGSRVLVTTRLENVASLMTVTDEHICHPRQLNEDECWAIIKQRAFGDNSVPEGLEGIGKQIAKSCKGVPLVASIIGATLQKKRDIREWQAITENCVWDSLEKEEGILDIIKFSYDRLPTLALKQCFAFYSIFPKDFVMKRDMLIQLWMAQGFLESPEESNTAAEDIGDKYFKYLLSYSLFQEEWRDNVTGSVESCRMHDLIHDFAQLISKSETLIVEEWPGSNNSRDVKHLNLIGRREMVPTVLGDVAKKLQTLFFEHGFSSGVQVDFKRLRVLSLNDAFDAKQLPSCFGNSKRLRYLDISRTQIEELPKFITKLYNLQTFRFMDCYSLKMPPGGIGDLINLRHIYFNDEERMPANLGSLTNLQTLPLFFVGTTEGRKIEELGSLRELKGRLEVCKLELVKGKSEAKKAKLHEKSVDVLQLCWRKEGNRDKLDEDVLEGLQPHSNIRILSIEGYGGRKLASWMLKNNEELLLLNNLVELRISNCRMLYRIPNISGFSSLQRLYVSNCDQLTSLGDDDGLVLTSMSIKELSIARCTMLERFLVGELSSLEKLTIEDCWVINSIGDSLSSSKCLKQLYLRRCPELKFIPSLEGFVCLKTIAIWCCDGLECLPSGLSSCTALEELQIGNCYNLVSIPKELKQLQSLVKLDIQECQKLKFISSLEGLVSLKTVAIWFCHGLECLPSGFSSCTALEELRILSCFNLVSIPKELKQLRSLVNLDIEGCQKLKFIPSLEGLVSLKTVAIRFCDGLEYLPSGLSSCIALEELLIWNCCNLISIPEELKQLRSLVNLYIWKCQKLRSFPEKILGSLASLKKLELGLFSEELEEFPNLSSAFTLAPLEVLRLEGWGESLTLPHQIQRLTALKDLTIKSFNGVEEALLGNLSCLKTLQIRDCTRLRCLLGGLSSLEKLEITECPNLVSFPGELKELRSLEILGCPKLVGFLEKSLGCCIRLKRLEISPFSEELEEFQSLSSIHTSLEVLALRGWEKLTHLPQIQHLTALKRLNIYNFSGMESLPDWPNNLSSLQRLENWNCPNKLKERCTKGSGPDWHKISHIPYILIDGEFIQFQSKY
ncbi:hypothetical protein SLE2022_222010 [Rubroshorea leprosula]